MSTADQMTPAAKPPTKRAPKSSESCGATMNASWLSPSVSRPSEMAPEQPNRRVIPSTKGVLVTEPMVYATKIRADWETDALYFACRCVVMNGTHSV